MVALIFLSGISAKEQKNTLSEVYFEQDSVPALGIRYKIVALPFIYYTPDTRWSFGAGGVSTFNFPKDSLGARRSNVTVGFAYTELKQLLVYFPFQLFPHNQKYWIQGEAGYYRYVYYFFGIGNDIDPDYIERYNAIFPRLRLNISQQITPGLYAGIRYSLDNFTQLEPDPEGLLVKEKITGYQGGVSSSLGIGVNYDTRDALFYPTEGWLCEATIGAEDRITGSTFKYSRISFEITKFLSFNKRDIWALNASGIFSFGNVPFHQMPIIGGAKKFRGYFEGKYRDNHLLLVQAEYRRLLFWRLGIVAFGGFGLVGANFNDLQIANARYQYGAGLRVVLDKTQKINIRADYGFGYRSKGVYLTFGEAF